MTLSLPDRPSLDQLKKQAYELQKAAKAQGGDLSLADAFHELATRYGFASWPKLKHYVEARQTPADYREAIEAGEVDRVRAYLRERPRLANVRLVEAERADDEVTAHPTALHVAITAGQQAMAVALMEHGADVDAVWRGRSPVHWAIEHCPALIEPLLAREARLDLATAANLGRVDVVERMLREEPGLASANPTGSPPLEWAAWGGQVEVAGLLLRQGVRPEDQPSAFGAAISMDAREVLRLLLDHCDEPAKVVNERRLLHRAVSMANTHDNLATVVLLLERGADRDVRDGEGRTPRELAVALRTKPQDPHGLTSSETVAGWLDGVIAVL